MSNEQRPPSESAREDYVDDDDDDKVIWYIEPQDTFVRGGDVYFLDIPRPRRVLDTEAAERALAAGDMRAYADLLEETTESCRAAFFEGLRRRGIDPYPSRMAKQVTGLWPPIDHDVLRELVASGEGRAAEGRE